MAGPRKVAGRARLVVGFAIAVLVVVTAGARGNDRDNQLPAPRKDEGKAKAPAGPEILPGEAVKDLCPAVPVCLGEVLKLASIANLDIAHQCPPDLLLGEEQRTDRDRRLKACNHAHRHEPAQWIEKGETVREEVTTKVVEHEINAFGARDRCARRPAAV